MVVGDALYLASVLAGLAHIAETFSFLLIAIKWAGVAYLCWLAFNFWTSQVIIAPSGAGRAPCRGSPGVRQPDNPSPRARSRSALDSLLQRE
ncbi:LysE family transporter [Rhizobium pisi]|uniref:LysE family transporter n=1 Tax=Rhizobium TaxID=379 RepID=UPI001FE00965|nr:LysE family transporter [Rhizobium pisi]